MDTFFHTLAIVNNAAMENWCFRTVVLENPLEILLDCKEIKPVGAKGNQPWIFIGRTDAEAEAPIFWPPVLKSLLVAKDPGARKDWRQEEKAATEGQTIGWYHRLNRLEFGQTLRDGEGQESLVFCSPWSRKSRTRLSNWTTIVNIGVHISYWISVFSFSHKYPGM